MWTQNGGHCPSGCSALQAIWALILRNLGFADRSSRQGLSPQNPGPCYSLQQLRGVYFGAGGMNVLEATSSLELDILNGLKTGPLALLNGAKLWRSTCGKLPNNYNQPEKDVFLVGPSEWSEPISSVLSFRCLLPACTVRFYLGLAHPMYQNKQRRKTLASSV